jgi:hypothetical protein
MFVNSFITIKGKRKNFYRALQLQEEAATEYNALDTYLKQFQCSSMGQTPLKLLTPII